MAHARAVNVDHAPAKGAKTRIDPQYATTWARLGTLALVMICMVIPGTLLGKKVVKGVSERHFKIAYRVALTVAGLKVLLIDGVRNWPIW